jgi:hypothetical protein
LLRFRKSKKVEKSDKYFFVETRRVTSRQKNSTNPLEELKMGKT